jgi:hypothetical protein
MLAFDRPLRWVGRVAQRIRNRLRHEPSVSSSAGATRYATLLAALAAVGSTPRPSLVLVAFCAAQLLAQLPITPGGLGFVDAGLTATLTLAGVAPADAVLTTFAYRLFTYWPAPARGHRRRDPAPEAVRGTPLAPADQDETLGAW